MTKILPKAAFVLSVGVLGFAYGFAAEAWNLFPKAHVEQAWRQARARFDVGEQPSEMCPIPVPCPEKNVQTGYLSLCVGQQKKGRLPRRGRYTD